MNLATEKKFIFNPSAITCLPIINHDDLFFPVRRILCVGQNYADHTREMGGDPSKEAPFFFGKPNEALIVSPSIDTIVSLPYPRNTELFHHEVELVVAIGNVEQGYDFSTAQRASQHVFGYALSLDMTRRDVQYQLKQQSRPWEAAKAMEQSAPISPLHLASELNTTIESTTLSLLKNGVTVQTASLSSLIWNCSELLCQASRYFDLQAGDLIFTGTPAGVGDVSRGDQLAAQWSNAQGENLLHLHTRVV